MAGKILIVIDMQNDFIDGSLGTVEAESIVEKVVEKIKKHSGKILYTQDTHYEGYLDTIEGLKLPVTHCIKGSEGWKLNSEVENELQNKGAQGFMKDTFGSTDLAKYLTEEIDSNSIESIELVGLCTDICVISNAMLIKAYLPEVQIIVDSNCCAGVSPQSHNRALEAMTVCHIDVH